MAAITLLKEKTIPFLMILAGLCISISIIIGLVNGQKNFTNTSESIFFFWILTAIIMHKKRISINTRKAITLIFFLVLIGFKLLDK